MATIADNRCPVCRAALWASDSETLGSKTCPRCGAELWVVVGRGPLFFVRQPGQSLHEFLAILTAPLFGISVDQAKDGLKGADSLDLVELIMEVEEALHSRRD